MTKEDVERSIPAALSMGYRLFDTATIYRNEEHVGRVLREEMARLSLPRSSIFVTSKLQTADQGYEAARQAIDRSLQMLNMEYLDLYLVHWPGASGLDPSDPQNAELRRGSWRALEEAFESGKLWAIGVSNYEARHLEEMKQYANILPAVNQIELHPLYYPKDVVACCQQMNIHIQAYSSLGRGYLLKDDILQKFPQIEEMAQRHQVSLSQIYLRWALQHGFGILPKSSNPERVKVNADLYHFCLSPKEMTYLDEIHLIHQEKICWNPTSVA